MGDSKYPANTLALGLIVLEALTELSPEQGATLQEVVEATGQNRSNVYRYLTTLCELNWLNRDEETYRYSIGAKFLQLTAVFLSQIDARLIARPLLLELANSTLLTAHYSIRDGSSIVYVDKVESPSPVQMRSRLGMTSPCHSTAMGKALLINLTQTEIERLFPVDLEPHSPNTLTTRKSLLDELNKVREVGYSTDIEENELGIRCVGAPIFDLDGGVIGAISLSGLAQEINSERILELGNHVAKVASEISQRMGWRPVARIIDEPVISSA